MAKPKTVKKPMASKNPQAQNINDLHWLIDHVTEMMSDFVQNENIDTALTGKERMWLIVALPQRLSISPDSFVQSVFADLRPNRTAVGTARIG